MKRKILQYGNPILEKISKEVTLPINNETANIINDLLDTIISISEYAAGLSAPQIGYLKRIIVCRRVDLENNIIPSQNQIKEKDTNTNGNDNVILEVMINPVIIKKSDQISKMYEGCLSINHGDLFGEVQRPFEIEVEYYNQNNQKQSLNAKGFLSHIIQHEIDHLNGILFLKYIKDPSKLYSSEELDKLHDK